MLKIIRRSVDFFEYMKNSPLMIPAGIERTVSIAACAIEDGINPGICAASAYTNPIAINRAIYVPAFPEAL